MRQLFEIPWDEVEAISELLCMKKEQLAFVEHLPYKCVCSHEGCTRFTTLKDFGAEPFFWSRQMDWVDLSQQKFYCGDHLKQYQVKP